MGDLIATPDGGIDWKNPDHVRLYYRERARRARAEESAEARLQRYERENDARRKRRASMTTEERARLNLKIRKMPSETRAAHLDSRRKRDQARRAALAAKLQKVTVSPADRMRRAITQKKGKCRKEGMEFTIALADLLPLPTHCPVLGVALDYSWGNAGTGKADWPSIDRIDNAKGYVPGNVWIVSYRANRIKNDATLEEIEKLAYALAARVRAVRLAEVA